MRLGESTLFWKLYSKRSTICFFIIMLLFLSCILRVATISATDFYPVDLEQNRLKITVSKQRGTIFDRNMIPITNADKKIIAVISPTPRAITAISKALEGDELEAVLGALKSGKPTVAEVDEYIKCDGIICTNIYEHSSEDMPAVHLVGYTDVDLEGKSGLELAYNELLYCENEVAVFYECDGKGRLLEGASPILQNDSSAMSKGVVSTIDISLQAIAENAAEHIETGAVIIAEAATGKIRATVSRPYFDCTKTAEYLNAPDSPLLNRSINAYNVGSVFKPCVAIAGIKNNNGSFCYTCTGSTEIIDRHFKCHKADGHGFMNLKSAIANSCNTYFYNFAFGIGAEEILNVATTLRFGKSLPLCDGISTAKGNLPQKSVLNNIAYLANFSIGQGELLLSPISVLTLYSAIANGGTYFIPSVVEGTINNGSFTEYNKGKATQVMSKEVAKLLQEYLKAVLDDGTGESAKPKTVSAAGKTATAQTGKYENGIEICEGWFCGFFPAKNPKYVVTVFSENTLRQSKSCGEIFSEIADAVTKLEK